MGWYIRLVLDGALRQACWMSVCLSSHRLLYYIVDLMRIRFVENGLVINVRWVSLPMVVMMVCGGAVEGALGIRHLDRILAHHLAIVRA